MIFMRKNNTRIRNADKARNSFVTRRAELKLSALGDLFKAAAGKHWRKTEIGTLKRKLYFSKYAYLDSLQLIYNWENRFMSVNYNLQMIVDIPTDKIVFEETGNCHFVLHCEQGGLTGKRNYSWEYRKWQGGDLKLKEYIDRLNNKLIIERLDSLDIMEIQIQYESANNYWRISCESLIGSATWILIPPVVSMITPGLDECIKFLELYELLGDAVINNKI